MKTLLALSLVATLLAMGARAQESRDTDYLNDVMNRRLESQRSGPEVLWMNPETGSSGIVVILGTDDSNPSRPCRTYRRTMERPGEASLVVEGRACRIADGLWQREEFSVAAIAPRLDPPAELVAEEPAQPPPMIPPPLHKPDPSLFYASIPTPSVY